MKQIKVRSLKYPNPAVNWDFQADHEEPKLSELLASGACGKPERTVLHKDEQGAEAYDDADVLEEILVELQPAIDAVMELVEEAVEAKEAVLDEEGNILEPAVEAKEAVYREVSPAVPAVIQKQVKLKAEYTVEIEDITAQYELKQCIAKRKAEYPSAEDFLNAYFDGGQTALDALQAARLAIKTKYPKP